MYKLYSICTVGVYYIKNYRVEQRISSVEGDRNILEELVEHVEGRMKGLEQGRTQVEGRVDQLQKEVEGTKPAYDIQVISLAEYYSFYYKFALWILS